LNKSFEELFADTLKRKQGVDDRINALFAVREDRVKEKTSILSQFSFSQAYLDKKDEVNEMLVTLQEKMQRKAKGFFEDLLTELVAEILPSESGRIVLDLSVKSNKTSLDVMIVKDGKTESVFADNGGALTNIISMGLRFIVLSRSSNRRFLVFDEADAWIKPANIPYFMKVVTELSRKLGIQVVVISHHDIEQFKSTAKIIRLERDQDGHVISILESDVEEEERNLGAFKSIRLRGFKSHTNTHIELSPYVTIIYGENNVGKSHISRAFNSLRNGDTMESNINHNANFCRVELRLEDNNLLSWEYHRKGKRKTQYKVIADTGEELESSYEGGKPPVWLNDYLFMDNINNLDVHVVDQKYPVYLIGDNISSFQRAEMLSLGSDNENVKFMIKKHNENIKEHQSIIRSGKRRLSYIEKDLKVIRNIEIVNEYIEKADSISPKIIDKVEYLKECSKTINNLKVYETKINAYKEVQGISDDLKSPDIVNVKIVPEIREIANRISSYERSIGLLSKIAGNRSGTIQDIHDITMIRETVHKIQALKDKISSLSKVKTIENIPEVNEIFDIRKIRELSVRMSDIQNKINLMMTTPKTIAGVGKIEDVVAIKETAKSLDQRLRSIEVLREKIKAAKEEAKKLADEEVEFLNVIGHKCPLCNGKIEKVNENV